MDLRHNLEALGCDASAKAVDANTRSSVANFRWEPAVSTERSMDYNEFVQDVKSHKDWKAEHKSYLDNCIHIPKDLPRSPECFTAINDQAHLINEFDNTYLIRLESLGHLFNNSLLNDIVQAFWERFYHYPKDLSKPLLNDESEGLRREFVSLWNSTRTQSRPLFATFLNDFGGNLSNLVKSDWPHLLRDRLGLTHWPSSPGGELPVALVCYTVDDVNQALAESINKDAVSCFTRPTVLDAEMSAAFVPAPLMPQKGCYGYTLDLSNTNCVPSDFTPELLTYPIEYKPTHIKALGFIKKPHPLNDGDALLNARNFHVQGMQIFSGNSNFGEVLK